MQTIMLHSDHCEPTTPRHLGPATGALVAVGVNSAVPEFAADGNYAVWFDGELFAVRGTEWPRTASAANHVLGELNRSHGFGFLRGLNGVFAIAVYDVRRNTGYLVTDRFGLRPLFYGVVGDGLCFAGELKAFVTLPGFPATVDSGAVHQFVRKGYLPGDSSWFHQVKLLPSASCLSWNEDSQALTCTRYWDWDEVSAMPGRSDPREVAVQLAHHLDRAVQRQAGPGERVGVTLSGGLDSRAILAALPSDQDPVPVFTFGIPGSRDVELAAQAAAVRGAHHYVGYLNSDNWLEPRFAGVWWTDGQLDMLHMHGIEHVPFMRTLFDISLNGFLGDAIVGGSYLKRSESLGERYENRGRRLIRMGPLLLESVMKVRFPFMDADLVEFALRIPLYLRRRSYIYNCALLHRFPEFFQAIPWQRTGVPITSSPRKHAMTAFLTRIRERTRAGLQRLGWLRGPGTGYTDYPGWLRAEPASRLIEQRLLDRDARIIEYVPRKHLQREWTAHRSGTDRSAILLRYLTVETWLRQLAFSNERPAGYHLSLSRDG